ncbi:AT-rich interactive domain-containing protein 2 isoform X1 [Cotesia glomerata]|uniref:AT-rich interactive domain-containing protein 2 isoform X1 n=2 Tax=Cotesia glomerata TaxID=32391 RepID=UPI001D016F62|nr:AT-rich interactive domain-containing protein 2 isoform X1 [Cotesia glomerata]XP_044582226.1 AT-rich interactive domain-containing protein 2 isoform X1 [Cotesia glomerata]XP_044582227.1 AT-rich interactive domain-containing protein 2 isoform X1 [Cotesia glomerata]XP_044582228.1 AT-rich interactive domain-containing protein 2 isoform X1 [Cotesia glomerata]XP_044582229.1 AT-rich interactive domain-containing protein 2 isoform X1 [Cotesia glomerata]
MAKILNKDPVTYERERLTFLKELHHFHETRGTGFKKYPKISGNEIDLYLLYLLVTAHGGWIKVNTRNEWSSLCEQFHLPSGCVNSGVGLKQIYLRYLDRYEKVHFLGEDGQQADDDDEDSRHRKWSARSLHSVPLTYNYHQHNVAESLREYNGLSSNLYKPSNYDKLALSLLSPLPNEQDFAINVCTLLSNEGKHTLRLDKYPRLINILLAHAGVFDSPGTRHLFIEVYSRVRNYSINSFWSDVLDSPQVLDLTDERTFMKKPTPTILNTFSRRKILDKNSKKAAGESKEKISEDKEQDKEQQEKLVNGEAMEVDPLPLECSRLASTLSISSLSTYLDEGCFDQNANSIIKFEEEDRDLFCMGRTLGTQDPYGQRVLQIASILRNLSFTPENAAVLGKNRCFLRFVLLCVRARWSNLHQLGFDILGNIANEIELKEIGERLAEGIINCIVHGIDSTDRFVVMSCLEVLNKISQQDCNEELVIFGLDDQVFELICRFLALSDIALLVYTLECLYALTSLGERPCTSLARVRGAIDTLVALVTVEAQSYGPKACILMRVVETVSTLATSTVSQSTTTTTTTSVPTPVATTPAVVTTASIPAPVAAPVVSPVTSRPTTPATPAVKAAANKAIEAANSLQQQHAHQQIIQENEQFALGWLRATFELAPGVKIEQEELYKKYLSSCTKIGRRGVIAPLHFPRCVRSVFGGTIGPNPQKGETTGTQYYEGIRVRATPAPITYPSQPSSPAVVTSVSSTPTPAKVLQLVQQRTVTKSPAPDSTALDNNASKTITNSTATAQTPASPILKAHLSAPPKPTPSNATLNQPQIITKVDSKSQVSVTHPHLSQALLASGSAQNQPPLQGTVQAQAQTQTQTQMVQVVTKDGGTTSSSIIKSLLATKVTVSGDCMPSAAATCVSTSSNACVTNTTSIPTTISANQLITNNQVAQRQQQQRLLQQQMATPTTSTATTPSTVVLKAPAKQRGNKKVQRLNGAKVVANNCEKMEVNDETVTSSTPSVIVSTENHIGQKVIRPPVTPKFITQKPYTPPVTEDSDSTNNSLASSSGIGRDCSGVAEEENSITSFEGILQNGATPDLDQDSSSKESSVSSRGKQNLMLADLLERKVDRELVNGVLKNMENHVKKEVKLECGMSINDDAMIEAPIKRSSDSEENSVKKVKYSNGTSSWNENDSVNVESTVSSIKSEEDQEEKVTVSSTAANLYAALAADIIEDENDLEEPVKEEPKFSEQVVQQIVQVPQQVPQQLIVAAPRQIVVQNNQVLIPGQMKARTTQPQVLLQQGAGGQLQYVVSGGVPGQNYVLAQSQTALVQGQAQTVLVAQTTQQQGTGAKTIIILQPQAAQGQGHQKVVAVTPQGQQVVVTQMPRPIMQNPSVGNLPAIGNIPPLVPTSSAVQNSIIVNTSIVTQSNPNTVTVTIPAMTQQCPVTSSLPSRVVTPTPASTPPPTRPTTPHQAAATNVKLHNKLQKVTTSTSTSTEDKPSTSQAQSEKVVIKLDPNAFLCEWRGCLKQFKTAHEVYMHGCEAHCPNDAEEVVCLWASCDGLKRRRFSLMTHLYDKHCNPEKMAFLRRKNLATNGKEVSTSTPAPSAAASAAATASHPGYAPNAALHAIKRHALEFINPKELMQQRPSKPAAPTTTVSSPRAGQNSTPEQDDNEGPVTKSIRLTAALILRNLVIYSAHGRRHLRAYEPHLAGVALSNVESSRTIAQVLYDMNEQSTGSSR